MPVKIRKIFAKRNFFFFCGVIILASRTCLREPQAVQADQASAILTAEGAEKALRAPSGNVEKRECGKAGKWESGKVEMQGSGDG